MPPQLGWPPTGEPGPAADTDPDDVLVIDKMLIGDGPYMKRRRVSDPGPGLTPHRG